MGKRSRSRGWAQHRDSSLVAVTVVARPVVMRHAETLAESRYTDHALPKLSTGIESLKSLWPQGLEIFSRGWKKSLASGGGLVDIGGAASMFTNTHNSDQTTTTAQALDMVAAQPFGFGPSLQSGRTCEPNQASAGSASIEAGNGHFRSELNPIDPLSGAIEALSAYVRVRLQQGADRERQAD